MKKIKAWRKKGDTIVFTNGCFDIIHRGHIEVLARTADLGDKLILGLNSDSSVKKIKGNTRPINDEKSRAIVLSSLKFVDAVVIFNEETPYKLIHKITPDILAKGGDYKVNEIAGHDIIKKNGGEIKLVPLVDGFSTSNIIEKINSFK